MAPLLSGSAAGDTAHRSVWTATACWSYALRTGPERNFQEAGLKCSPPLKMLTTTLQRLKNGGGVFGAGVWSDYGTATSLFPPDVAP